MLPPPIVSHGGRIAELQEPLHPEECHYLAGAVASRVAEFTAGRACARAVLRQLGVENEPVRIGPRREPLWPDGIVGSISHAAGYCLAAACRRRDVAALGVDLESALPLPSTLFEMICVPAEREWCERRDGMHDVMAKFVFSIKESVFKCLYPLFGRELEFHDVVADIDLEHCRYLARVSGAALGTGEDLEVAGRIACTHELVLCSAMAHEPDIVRLPGLPSTFDCARPRLPASLPPC